RPRRARAGASRPRGGVNNPAARPCRRPRWRPRRRMTPRQRSAPGEGAEPLIRAVRRAVSFEPPPAADREDLVQETLLRLWKRLATRGELGPASGLIRTIVRRLRIDGWRRRREAEEASEDEPRSREPSPLDDAGWNELREIVRSAVEEL